MSLLSSAKACGKPILLKNHLFHQTSEEALMRWYPYTSVSSKPMARHSTSCFPPTFSLPLNSWLCSLTTWDPVSRLTSFCPLLTSKLPLFCCSCPCKCRSGAKGLRLIYSLLVNELCEDRTQPRLMWTLALSCPLGVRGRCGVSTMCPLHRGTLFAASVSSQITLCASALTTSLST